MARFQRGKQFLGKQEVGIVTVLPVVIALQLLFVPAAYILWLSVYRDGITFDGYWTTLNDSVFWSSFWSSVLYTLVTVFFQMLLGVLAAAIVHRQKKYLSILTVILFLPYAVPSIVAVMSWQFLLNDNGALAEILKATIGLEPSNWMNSWIFSTLVVISIWQFYPFVMVGTLAQLRRISPQLYTHAVLDGANFWQQFYYITLPQIRNTVIVIAILRIAFMFTKYDTPWLLGGGTAIDTLNTLPIYIDMHMKKIELNGEAVVAASVLLAFTIALSAGSLYIFHKRHFQID